MQAISFPAASVTLASAQTVPEVNQERMPGMFTVTSLVGPTLKNFIFYFFIFLMLALHF